MTINSPACLANSTTSGLVNSSAGSLLGDLRPSSRDSGGGGRGGGTPVACSSTTAAVNSGGVTVGGGNGSALGLDRSSPRSHRDRSERSTFGSGGIPSPLSEPIAGPSGMGPVQQVPLVSVSVAMNSLHLKNQQLQFYLQSLKKEIDWDRGDDKSSGDSSLDFRHPHDSVSDSFAAYIKEFADFPHSTHILYAINGSDQSRGRPQSKNVNTADVCICCLLWLMLCSSLYLYVCHFALF